MKLLFLTRSLEIGGAERQLVQLACGLVARGHDVVVAQMYSGGAFEQHLRQAGVNIVDLAKRGRWDAFGFARRFVALVRRLRPDIIHSYLVTPNLIAAMLKPMLGPVKLVWGVRAAFVALESFDWFARVTFKLSCAASGCADLIIVNSEAGKRHHAAVGFPADRMQVIVNGIDTEHFRPRPELSAHLRREWGIDGRERLIGMVGRLDPMKDHSTFLEAAARLGVHRSDLRFVCIGGGTGAHAERIRRRCGELGLDRTVHWVPSRNDMPATYSALDLVVLSSVGESFPNVLAEAMACGVPCVSTDVGDASAILGDAASLVPPKNPGALAAAVERALQANAASPEHLRRRIVDNFSVQRMVATTEQVLCRLLVAR